MSDIISICRSIVRIILIEKCQTQVDYQIISNVARTLELAVP